MTKKISFVVFPGGPGLGTNTLEQLVQLLPANALITNVNLPRCTNIAQSRYKNFDQVCDWIVDELHHAREPFVMLGHSYGSVFAAEIAMRIPAKVSGFIAIASPLSVSMKSHLDDYQGELRKVPAFGNAWQEYLACPTDETYRALSKSYIPYLSNDLSVQATINRLFTNDSSSPLATRHWQKPKSDFAALEHVLASFDCPKLAILGEEDRLVPVVLANHDYEQLGFRVTRVPGGHFPFLESKKAIEQSIATWIRK
jgi:pimeloyl-ACP methyl ester carboxylesterase